MLFSYWGFTLMGMKKTKQKRNGISRAFYYGVTYLFLISFLPPVFLVMIYEALYIKVLNEKNKKNNRVHEAFWPAELTSWRTAARWQHCRAGFRHARSRARTAEGGVVAKNQEASSAFNEILVYAPGQ